MPENTSQKRRESVPRLPKYMKTNPHIKEAAFGRLHKGGGRPLCGFLYWGWGGSKCRLCGRGGGSKCSKSMYIIPYALIKLWHYFINALFY